MRSLRTGCAPRPVTYDPSPHGVRAVRGVTVSPYLSVVPDRAMFVSCYSWLTHWGSYTREVECAVCGRMFVTRSLPSGTVLRRMTDD